MKKDTFLKGALISTLCIVLSKILGIIYVIPFHAIIGENGRTLYGYAYNMYMLFLNFSTVGIPLAVSKIVSEYHSLEYEDAKKRTYRIAVIITSVMAILSTIALFVLAPSIANTIIGDMQGGNTKEDIAFVIRVSASAIFFVTMLSGVRGFLQGHKYITAPSISQIIEQFVRVIVIIVGSFVAMKLWGTKEAVGIAIFGATAGGIAALLYLQPKVTKLKKKNKNIPPKEEEKKLNNKFLTKQLLKYTIPFIIVSIAVSLYNTIDMLFIVKPLVNYGKLSIQDAETVLSIISTWGAKLNSIVTSIAAGTVVSVLPNITSDYTKKKYKEVNQKINKALLVILFFVVPMVFGLSFLATPVWQIFYGTSTLGVSVFKMSIFTSLFYSIFLNMHTIMQSVDRHKTGNIAIAMGLILKIGLTVPLIILFSRLDFIPTYYGSIVATIVAYIIPITIYLFDLKKHLSTSFKNTLKNIINILLSCMVMLCALSILKLILPLNGNKIYSVIVVAIYSIIGGMLYIVVASKLQVFKKVFGTTIKEIITKFTKKGGNSNEI